MQSLIRHPSLMEKDEDDIEPAPLYVGDWIDFTNQRAAKIARASGVSESYISMLSGGARKNVSIRVLTKLSLATGIAIGRFFEAPPRTGAPVPVKRQEMASLGDIRQRARDAGKRRGK